MEPNDLEDIINTLENCFISTGQSKSPFDPINIATAMNRAAYNLKHIAESITPTAIPMRTPDGGQVGSLTEAVIYTAQSLEGIAAAIQDLAEAVRERNDG